MSHAADLYKEAFAAFTRGENDAAIDQFLKAVDAEPGFALAYQGLAEVYSRSERLDEAIQAIQKAIDAEPGESLYYTSLSRFLQRQGRIPEAEAAAARAAQLQAR